MLLQILEASDTNTELGLGITVPPNAAKALVALGYQPKNLFPKEWKEVCPLSFLKTLVHS